MVAAMMAAGPATAATVGFYSDDGFAYAGAQTATATAGHGFVALTDLTAGSLAGINVLWLANGDNSSQLAQLVANLTGVSDFVSGGGVLVYNDRQVDSAETVLPGIGSTDLIRDFSDDANIEVVNAGTSLTNGPGGIIDDLTLDGGSSSSHGMTLLGDLPAGARAILSRGAANEIVDFTYAHGQGFVHYSTIPLDYYLAGNGSQPAFAAVYAPNLVDYAAGLTAPVPLPATLPLALGALAGMAPLLRRRRSR